MYLVDSDVFIQAKNAHYGIDFCPGFWSWLDRANAVSRVFSVEKCGQELEAGDDDLAAWARARRPFFLKPSEAVVTSLREVAAWTETTHYKAAAIAEFLSVADSFLVAHARAQDFTVVTHEKPEDTLKKIKIPNACVALGVPYILPYEMLRAEGARFTLAE